MIEINLLPEGLRRKETLRIALPAIPIKKFLFAIGIVAAAFQILLTLSAFYVRFELISLNHRTDAMRQKNRQITRQKDETLVMSSRLKEIQSITARKFYWTSLLSELSNSMTKGIWLRNLYVNEESVRVVKSEEGPKKEKNEKNVKSPKNKKSENSKKDEKAGKAEKAEKSEKEKISPESPERKKVLVLEGTAIGAGQETEFIGKFLKELKDNAFFAQTFQEMKPSNINQKRIGDYEVYEFMIRCQFKRDKTG